MKEIKRYTPIIESDDSCDMFPSIEETINGIMVKYTDHKAVVDSINKTRDDLLLVADHRWDELKKAEKRIDELEAERKQIKSAIDPGYDDIRYSMMLVNEILKEV